jgi:hypothetical protein
MFVLLVTTAKEQVLVAGTKQSSQAHKAG